MKTKLIETLPPTKNLPPMFIFGQGDPCQKGETSSKTGCTPASGGGGKAEGEGGYRDKEGAFQPDEEALGRGPRVGKPSSRYIGGTEQIDHGGYQEYAKGLSNPELEYTIKDAKEALEINPEGVKSSVYADEINYAAMELTKRKKIEEEGGSAPWKGEPAAEEAPSGGGDGGGGYNQDEWPKYEEGRIKDRREQLTQPGVAKDDFDALLPAADKQISGESDSSGQNPNKQARALSGVVDGIHPEAGAEIARQMMHKYEEMGQMIKDRPKLLPNRIRYKVLGIF